MQLNYEKEEGKIHWTVGELGFFSKGYSIGVTVQTDMSEQGKYRKDFDNSPIKDV